MCKALACRQLIPDPPHVIAFLEPLVAACSRGDTETVESLLADWDPSSKTYRVGQLCPALMVAAEKCQLEVISLLLRKGLQLYPRVICAAVRARAIPSLERFLSHGWDINHEWLKIFMTDICVAIACNDIELVQWFLSHGANADLRNNRHRSLTPLSIAVIYASLDIVKLLVAYGARVDRGDLLACICESRMPGRLVMIEYLVDLGAPINGLERVGSRYVRALTPLHKAAYKNRPAFAAMLLRFGADKGKRCSRGQTPLDLAKELQLPALIELLEAN